MKINHTQIIIKPKLPFHFEYTACSHGWVDLAPNRWDAETKHVHRTQLLSNGKVVFLEISESGTSKRPNINIDVSHQRTLSLKEKNEITNIVTRMFRTDVDLSAFYAICKKKGKRWHPVTNGMGRLLRSPSVFEDIVKTIATVNMQWGGTKAMIARLVDELGEPFPGDPTQKAFPTPQSVAKSTEIFFQKKIKMGFRNPFVITLAQRITNNDLNVEDFLNSKLSTIDLKKSLKKIKGVGDYASANLLMLLDRYDELTIDTVCRDFMKKKYFKEEIPSDEEIIKKYEKWKEWKFLAYWFDLWLWYEQNKKK